MMGSLFPCNSLQMALTATVFFMVVLTTCSTEECRLQLGEKNKKRSVILMNIDIKMCHANCVEGAFILAWCLQIHDSRQTRMSGGNSPEKHHNVLKPSCGSKACNTTSVCLEKGCSKECVQAPSFCDLHMASKTGNLAKVKVILSQKQADMNCKEWNRRTPVMVAAGEGRRDVVQLLVSNGANMSVEDDFGMNILHAACQGGDVMLVKYVLLLGNYDINGKVLCGGTPVMLAAESGHREVMELLVGEGSNVSLHDNIGNNILHFACRGGEVEVVKYVLSQGMVDINSRGWKRMTPVMTAAEKGHKDVVELLMRNGANVVLKGKYKTNILHYACLGRHVEVVKYVLSQNIVKINTGGWKGVTPLMMAAKEGHRGVVELLVRKGADVSPKGTYKNNILHFACRGGHVEMVKYVLSENLEDINSRNRKGMTPMFMAAEKGNKEVVELFFRRGADMSLVSRGGKNILHFACRGGNMDLVGFVLSQKMIDIDTKGGVHFTPLLTAAARGYKEVVELLVSEGAKVSLVDVSGNNILHLACRRGHVEVVKYVLSQNMVDINSRNKKGMTSVMMAAEEGHQELVDLLLSKGAKRSLEDNK